MYLKIIPKNNYYNWNFLFYYFWLAISSSFSVLFSF